MKKRWILAAVFMITLCVSCFELPSTEAQAAELSSGTCGDKLTWVLDDEGTLTISGIGNMTDYSANHGVYSPWYDQCDNIYRVVVENGVTSIGKEAFQGHTKIQTIALPSSLISINENAFSQCYSLKNVTIPNNVSSIGDYVFAGCTSLSEVNIGTGLGKISVGAFAGCTSISQILLPNNITIIDNDAFEKCTSLTSVTFPNSLKRIGNAAFGLCENLTSVVLPDSVTRIGEYAFIQCDNLMNIKLPAQITAIEDGVFEFCNRITYIEIPATVSSIGHCAFECESLKHVFYQGTEQQWLLIDIGTGDGGHKDLVSATRHYLSSDKAITVNKNCTLITYHCTICNSEIGAIPLLEDKHTYDNVCDTTCNICSSTRSVSHSYDNGKVTKNATCKEEGVKTYTCIVCKETKTEEIAKLTSHTSGLESTAIDNQVCTVCGKALTKVSTETQPIIQSTEKTTGQETKPIEPTLQSTNSATQPTTQTTESFNGTNSTVPDTVPTESDNTGEEDGRPWIIVTILATVILGASATVGIILWNKKH